MHPSAHSYRHRLLLGNDNLSVIDGLDDIMRRLSVNGASDRLGSSENLLDTTGEVLGERLVGHFTGNLGASGWVQRGSANQAGTHRVDLVEGNVTRVLDVLLLLAVSRGLCRGLVAKPGCS
jgi:hypothetical protein